MKLFEETTFWLFVAVAIFLFSVAFRGLSAIALSKLPSNGLTETIAAH